MKHHKDSKKGQYPHLAKASLLLLGSVLVIGITSHVERGVWSKKIAEAEKGSASECQVKIDAANELVTTGRKQHQFGAHAAAIHFCFALQCCFLFRAASVLSADAPWRAA